MRLSFIASVESFNQAKYITAVKEAIRLAFIKGGRQFLLAAVPRVPIWAGMARGAFRNAEDLFGKVGREGSGYRIRTTRGGGAAAGPRLGYYYYPPGGARIQRTPQAGRQFATPANQIIGGTPSLVSGGRTNFYFRFKIDITYFTRLDDAKWGAFRAGTAALESYVRANLKLPDPVKFITRKQIKVG